MKSKIFQFLSVVVQMCTLEEEKDSTKESINYIDDKELLELITKVIYLIVDSLKDVLINKEKYYSLKHYELATKEEADCFNLLLFTMYVFLNRSLTREPIKSEFSAYVKNFY